MAGTLSSAAELLIGECSAAGVVLRRPSAGRLRPILNGVPPSKELLARVTERREEIVLHLEGLFSAVDELRDDAANECAERGGRCSAGDDCPWIYECRIKGERTC